MNFVIRLVVNAAALWLAARFVNGIHYTGGWQGLVGVAVVFGVINAFVRPVLSFLSMPIQFVTLGLFTLVLNALMLMLTGWAAERLSLGFAVAGFVPALLGAILVSVVSMVLSSLLTDEKDERLG
jgi:putative membrane protein